MKTILTLSAKPLLIAFSFFFLVGSANAQITPVDSSGKKLEYKIAEEKISDIPVKTQVAQHIVVWGNVSERTLQELLGTQHREISGRRGFEHHTSPTNIYIYLYDTKEKALAGQGLWLAMSQMNFGESKPKTTVRTELLTPTDDVKETKYGLTIEQRQKAYKEVARLGTKAMDEAMKREPTDINKQIALEDKLYEDYKVELGKKYNITGEQLQEILIEGVTKQWVH